MLRAEILKGLKQSPYLCEQETIPFSSQCSLVSEIADDWVTLNLNCMENVYSRLWLWYLKPVDKQRQAFSDTMRWCCSLTLSFSVCDFDFKRRICDCMDMSVSLNVFKTWYLFLSICSRHEDVSVVTLTIFFYHISYTWHKKHKKHTIIGEICIKDISNVLHKGWGLSICHSGSTAVMNLNSHRSNNMCFYSV